ncbi:MAG: response regulator transcription factor [Ardenticatenaceae bacterium]|nr:response regulator transcription factor [Ardenticatenaceae bacterium]HBY94348.1 DNA-binding response regulator [Chloroflexota bacterium]
MIRVLLVDDHEVVRLGLRTVLEQEPDINVVGEASTAEQAVTATLHLEPDVVLMDIRLPDRSGIEATRELLQQGVRCAVIMLTSYADDNLILEAIKAGAAGYLLKRVGSHDVVRAVRTAAAGEALLDPSITRRVLDHLRAAQAAQEAQYFQGLSERERVILALIVQGRSNAEIATTLYLSEKTVRNYVSTILATLGVTNRIEAANVARKHHIERHL